MTTQYTPEEAVMSLPLIERYDKPLLSETDVGAVMAALLLVNSSTPRRIFDAAKQVLDEIVGDLDVNPHGDFVLSRRVLEGVVHKVARRAGATVAVDAGVARIEIAEQLTSLGLVLPRPGEVPDTSDI